MIKKAGRLFQLLAASWKQGKIMSANNVRDVREILASIEALNEQADCLQETDEHQNNAPVQDSLPASLVAEMSAHKAEVVLLDEIWGKGASYSEHKPTMKNIDSQEEINRTLASEVKSAPSEAEFDKMLSSLMKDINHQHVESKRSPPSSGRNDTHGPSDSTNSKASIDGLLSPHLNTSATAQLEPEAKHQRAEEPNGHLPLQVDDKLLSLRMTDELRVQISDYFLAEIKQQISDWVSENLEKILEDTLRSVSTEARDAVRARAAR